MPTFAIVHPFFKKTTTNVYCLHGTLAANSDASSIAMLIMPLIKLKTTIISAMMIMIMMKTDGACGTA